MEDHEMPYFLLKEARKALCNAYAPYSKIRVGAALLTRSGKCISGANVENASYGLSMCAERVALYRALAEGHRFFKILALVSNQKTVFYPCGACLQVLAEFSPYLTLLLKVPSDTFLVSTVSELLTHPFGSLKLLKNSKHRIPIA